MRTWRLLVALICFVGYSSPAGSAALATGRDFTGFYELADVVDHGETASVALAVRVFNDSDAALFGATVWLLDPHDLTRTESFLGALDIPERGGARVSNTIVIRREEHERWEQGGMPHLFLRVDDGSGSLQDAPPT